MTSEIETERQRDKTGEAVRKKLQTDREKEKEDRKKKENNIKTERKRNTQVNR